jgi:hypothetical protein
MRCALTEIAEPVGVGGTNMPPHATAERGAPSAARPIAIAPRVFTRHDRISQYGRAMVERAQHRTRSRGLVLGVVFGIMLACGSVGAEELVCEDAVAHLADCCPGFDPVRFNCQSDAACGGEGAPALTVTAGDCVRSRNCSELNSSGVCAGLVRLSYEAFPGENQSEIERQACD